MPASHLVTPLPGPKARALLERDRAVITPSFPRDYPFVMARGAARKSGTSTATASSTS